MVLIMLFIRSFSRRIQCFIIILLKVASLNELIIRFLLDRLDRRIVRLSYVMHVLLRLLLVLVHRMFSFRLCLVIIRSQLKIFRIIDILW